MKTLKDAIEIIMAEPPEPHYPAYYADLLREADVPDKDVGELVNESRDLAKGLVKDDCISRAGAIDAMANAIGHYPNERYQNLNEYEFAKSLAELGLKDLPPARPEIIHCCDCIYYDPEHIEKNGVRYEYKDMPKTAFDILGTGLVNSEYGINVGGRCCRDYNAGYSEDKRVFVSEQNYCGRARRRQDE